MSEKRRVAIIGAGYAGLACAVELAARGVPATVFESAREPGGRARVVQKDGFTLDNGQHVLVGAYTETLRLMRTVGVHPERVLRRMPLTLYYPGKMSLIAPRLPAPFNLAVALWRARGLSSDERSAAFRLMNTLRRNHYRLSFDMPVSRFLEDELQPKKLRRLLWEPLCISALNTPPDEASAQIFINVLQDTLSGSRRRSDLLIPRTDMTRLFPRAACEWIRRRLGEVRLSTEVQSLHANGAQFALRSAGRDALEHFDRVVVATAPYHAGELISSFHATLREQEMLSAFGWEPIVTCYLKYDERVRLPRPMIGMYKGYAQWAFDRGRLGGPKGLIALVISARGRHRALRRADLAATLHEELAKVVHDLPAPEWSQVITEKRATFACRPGVQRPGVQTPVPGLYLCGDYTASRYPATIEAAVRSGVSCANLIAQTP